jgi:hypothetical protein
MYAWALLAVMVVEVAWPTAAWALTSGPGQPEVQGFTPIGNTDMVDLFSGDFSYNIPLMDVEGYPINLSYQAGISMDQEASWVGLGWSLNPGVVERNLRGIPDDFKGDVMTKDMHLRPHRTTGASVGLDLELWAVEVPDVSNSEGSLQLSLAPTFSNYDGVSFSTGVNFSMKSCEKGKGTFNSGLGLNSSSHDGLRVQPFAGYDRNDEYAKRKSSWALGFGMSLSSRQGLTNISFNSSVRSSQNSKSYRLVKSGAMRSVMAAAFSRSIGTSFDLGSPTYSPQLNLPMKNTSLSGSFKLGVDIGGAFSNPWMSGFYSVQELRTNSISTPAYGYLHLQEGQSRPEAQLDFNREKDGPYSADQTSLPIAQLTNDVFSASGQNISGSYRPYRNDVGHVFDPRCTNTGSGGSLGVEIGPGNPIKWGADVVVNNVSSWSGDWKAKNLAGSRLRFQGTSQTASLREPVTFREANEPIVERDEHLYSEMHADHAARPVLEPVGGYDMKVLASLEDRNGNVQSMPGSVIKNERDPHTQLFSYLTHDDVVAGLGVEEPVQRSSTPTLTIPGHHMSEVTILAADGARNVYGIPAYNLSQVDAVFSINPNESQGLAESVIKFPYYADSVATGSMASKDQYSSIQHTPAYAHSFLLTAALSADYSDVDGDRGPSPDDLGTYTKFAYVQHDAEYHWRTPVFGGGSTLQARLDKGNLATAADDKASITYGTKEIWYLKTIESRNLVAVFNTGLTPRCDGYGVNEDGSLAMADNLLYLDNIVLYERRDWEDNGTNAIPIKTAHFDYTYTLCPAVPNNPVLGGDPPNDLGGKLTLRSVWFTYGTSNRGITSPYVFHYADEMPGDHNPFYNGDAQDRWGQYKPNGSLANQSFPYAEQDPASANSLAAAWNMIKIELPSGGAIDVTYESDDYAFVQNKEANRMFKVYALSTNSTTVPSPLSNCDLWEENVNLFLEVPPDLASVTQIEDYLSGLEHVYFRMKVEMDATGGGPENKLGQDYVSGYAQIESYELMNGNDFIRLQLKPVPMDGDDPSCGSGLQPNCVSPMYRAAMDHLRLNYPREAYAPTNFSDGDPWGKQMVTSMATATFNLLGSLGEFFNGPNAALRSSFNWTRNFCQTAVLPDCWVRLREPDQRKMGGGHRVHSIVFHDSWSDMGTSATSKSYGQVYTYTTTEPGSTKTISSGVAAYEPMIGSDENPWRQPYYYSQKVKLSPDERFYQEEPFGESMFPGPSIGYSKVTVQDFEPDCSTCPPNTGTVVNEFYTAKDFPVILERTEIDRQRKRSNFSVFSLLGVKMKDHSHTSQGFAIETNDMHGKPKRTTVYPEPNGSSAPLPLSYVEYIYQTAPYGSSLRLTNDARTITPNGVISNATIGRHYEFIADMREFGSRNTSGGLALNSETTFAIVMPLTIPIPLPKYSMESTRYRSATFVKKISRFGLLEKVVKMENGSVVSTENLAYDARTGGVLLTRTRNDFEDPVYTMNFPAYWHYDGMGAAYANLGAEWPGLAVTQSGVAGSLVDADKVFVVGDELALTASPAAPIRAWVTEATPASIHLIDAFGTPIPAGTYDAKVLRSGRRNMMGVNMTNITTLTDPLQGLGSNAFDNILQAQIIELKDNWRSNCACIEDGVSIPYDNPFRLNRKGVWRLNKEHAWLTERTRSIEDNNSNIRKDGTFVTFDPFYKLNSGAWHRDTTGWTMVREVTDYSDRGQELENRDALNLFSSASFGYGGSLPKTVARNARYQETGFEGFEEATPSSCTDRHFRFEVPTNAIVNSASHTGRRSVKVSSGSPIVLTANIADPCPNGCLLNLGWEQVEGDVVISADLGTAPYTFSTETIAGTPIIGLSGNSGLVVEGMGWSVEVTVTDANGCSSSTVITQ